MTEDPSRLGAAELLHQYRRRTLSPVEALESVLQAIERFEPAVNAFVLVDRERALEAARASEARWSRGEPAGLLDGVPTTVKDLVDVAGWPTRRGSLTTPETPAPVDAPMIARLREQGAVLVGKTTTPEFGWKGVTDSPLSGITRNPWDLARTPGGSSGGAAVAAALGMGALHTGSDGGGSIRIPAGFTGVFGLKPTFGRVPAHPLSPFGTISHLGPITRRVEDAALMLTVIAAPDSRDWTALPPDGRDYRLGLEDGVRGLRVGWCPDPPRPDTVDVHPDVAAGVERVAGALEELGARVEMVPEPWERADEIFRVHWYVAAAHVVSGIPEARRGELDPGLLEIAAAARDITSAEYLAATVARGALGERLQSLHEELDLLLTPTLPIPAFSAGEEVADPGRQSRWPDWTPFSYPFNLSQQPACTIPAGFTADGLPVGAQLVGRKYADHLVLRAARAVESVMPFVMPEAPRGGPVGA